VIEKIEKILENDWVKSFIFYSIFRAFYGAGILLVTWVFATESQAPLWITIIFLLCSMIFSRILLNKIKQFSSRSDEN
tara:strand:- start:11753 stop:11986 length:234 start_codon:yes stop_codon:yes gene_type:complete